MPVLPPNQSVEPKRDLGRKLIQGERLSIREVSVLLNRTPHTIRMWEHKGLIPVTLFALRDVHNRRYWTPELIDAIRNWIKTNDFYPGSSFATYKPSPERLEQHLDRLRGKRPVTPAQRVNLIAHPDLYHQIENALEPKEAGGLGMTSEEVLAMIPRVAHRLRTQMSSITLEDILQVFAEVLASRAERDATDHHVSAA